MNELDAKLKEIAENLRVQAELVERFERRTDKSFAQHEERMQRVEDSLARHQERMQWVDDSLARHQEGMQRIDDSLVRHQDRMQRIEDSLLVQTKLVERFEQRTQERLGDHEDRSAEHRERIDHIDRLLKDFAEGNRILQAAVNGLAETVDRFIRGQQGDGRG